MYYFLQILLDKPFCKAHFFQCIFEFRIVLLLLVLSDLQNISIV